MFEYWLFAETLAKTCSLFTRTTSLSQETVTDNTANIRNVIPQCHANKNICKPIAIAMFFVTSPIVINVLTTGLLAVETMHAIVGRQI